MEEKTSSVWNEMIEKLTKYIEEKTLRDCIAKEKYIMAFYVSVISCTFPSLFVINYVC